MITRTIAILAYTTFALSLNNNSSAQGTAFTYQGRLNTGGVAANDTNDFTFTLFLTESGGSPVASPAPIEDVRVSDGLFVATVDFGSGVFTGAVHWLEMGVRPGNSTGSYTTLSPRQRLNPTPYAIRSLNAGTASLATTANSVANGAVTSAALQNNAVTSAKIANGSIQATDLDATLLTQTFWRLDGNAGTTPGTHFIGTTDNQPLEFKVNGLRAFRVEDNGDSSDSGTTPDGAPNVIGGSPLNFVAAGVVGAVIGGGGATNHSGSASTNSVLSDFGVVGGGYDNKIAANCDSSTIAGGGLNDIGTYADYSAIGGGINNNIGTYAYFSAIGGGYYNDIADYSGFAAIVGGIFNTIGTNAYYSAIGGGKENHIADNAGNATIAGGYLNDIGLTSFGCMIGGGAANIISNGARYATIPGGLSNAVNGAFAFAAGRRAKANHFGTFVWADSQDTDFASATGNEFAVRASGGVRLVTGGAGVNLDGNPLVSAPVTSAQIGDGAVDTADLANSAVTSGKIANGTIQPVDINLLSFGTTFWKTDGNGGTTAGTHFLGTTDNQPLELKVNGLRALRLENNGDSARDSDTIPDGAPNVIGGSPRNFVAAGVVGVVIGGGGATNHFGLAYTNSALSDFGVVGGGIRNSIASNSISSTIAGGAGNDIGTNAYFSAIGGGQNNSIADNSYLSTIAGGFLNNIGTNASSSAIGGGDENQIADNSFNATIAGGSWNDIGTGSQRSAIGGGYLNIIADNSSGATIAGGYWNDVGTNSSRSAIGGGFDNNVADNSSDATIAGGYWNDVGTNSSYSAIGGGFGNNVADDSPYSTIAGGAGNDIADNSFSATIAGGDDNDIGINSDGSSIGGGLANNVAYDSQYSTIAGGHLNNIGNDSHWGAIGGGANNGISANSTYATIPGGRNNTAQGDYSFAAGRRARANHNGAFIWADSTDADFLSDRSNQLKIRAGGGVHLVTGGSGLNPAGLRVAPTTGNAVGLYVFQTSSDAAAVFENRGTGPQIVVFNGPGSEVFTVDNNGDVYAVSFNPSSDRNRKENFVPVNPTDVLEKVARLPISRWNFKGDTVAHLGPMAQDFHAAFGVGPDDKHIATVDADGVALAAIQGLNQKVEEQRAQLASKDRRIAELEKRLLLIEAVLNTQPGKD